MSFLHRLLVATQNGFLYVYDVSEVEGGDCKLIVKHNLRNVETQPIKIQGKVAAHFQEQHQANQARISIFILSFGRCAIKWEPIE